MDFENYDVIPVVRELSADTLTPLVAFAALSGDDSEAFLFESVERGENLGRYSFVGFEPRRSLALRRARVSDPVRMLNDELRAAARDRRGGAAAVLRRRRRLLRLRRRPAGPSGSPTRVADDLGIPDAKLLFFDNVVVFDHVRQRLYVVANIFTKDGTLARRERAASTAPSSASAAPASS